MSVVSFRDLEGWRKRMSDHFNGKTEKDASKASVFALCTQSDLGKVCKLVLEKIPGEGKIYPDPIHNPFVVMDHSFLETAKLAVRWALDAKKLEWQKGTDIIWSLQGPYSSKDKIYLIEGNSIFLAFCVGIYSLLSRDPSFSLEGVAVSATTDTKITSKGKIYSSMEGEFGRDDINSLSVPTGSLSGVGGVIAKLLDDTVTLKRVCVDHVIISSKQKQEEIPDDARDGKRGYRLTLADSVDAAIEEIQNHGRHKRELRKKVEKDFSTFEFVTSAYPGTYDFNYIHLPFLLQLKPKDGMKACGKRGDPKLVEWERDEKNFKRYLLGDILSRLDLSYLFDLDLGDDFSLENILNSIREKFKHHDMDLSQDATIQVVQVDAEWEIEENQNKKNKKWSVKKDKEAFRVYDKIPAEDRFRSALNEGKIPDRISEELKKHEIVFPRQEGIVILKEQDRSWEIPYRAGKIHIQEKGDHLSIYMETTRILVAGPPASGKSTLLRYIAREMALLRRSIQGRYPVPVFISLRDWLDYYAGEKATRGQLWNYLSLCGSLPKISESIWENWIRTGHAILFLDGLDEISGHKDEKKFVSDVLCPLLKEENSLCPVIFSCRTVSVDQFENLEGYLQPFRVAELDEMSGEGKDNFAQRRHFIEEQFPFLSDRFHKDKDKDKVQKRNLIHQITSSPQMMAISGNPYLLSMICFLADTDGHEEIELPSTVEKFYDKVIDRLLQRGNKGINTSIQGIKKRLLLEIIAWKIWVQEEERLLADEIQMLGMVVEGLKELPEGLRYDSSLNIWAEEYLDDYVGNSGILRKSARSYFFVHRSLQEYLVASHLIRRLVKEGWKSAVVDSKGEEKKIFDLLKEKGPLPNWQKIMSFLSEAQGGFEGKTEYMERPFETSGFPYIRSFYRFHNWVKKICGRKYHEHILPAGFTYLRTAQYECGGQRHTVHEYLHKKTGLEFVLIPSGTFLMGSSEFSGAQPIHAVRIEKPFLMCKTAVTQRAWKKMMGEENNPSSFKGDNLPVERITWYEAEEFCKKAGLSLPSEAQWEYACRAGTGSKWYFGNDESKLGDYAWYRENSGGKMHPVGEKKEGHNAFGLYDMMGNVWEWCMDGCESWLSNNFNYNHVLCDGSAYIGSGSDRVRRGGSYYDDAVLCSSGLRNFNDPGYRYGDLGLRVGLSLC